VGGPPSGEGGGRVKKRGGHSEKKGQLLCRAESIGESLRNQGRKKHYARDLDKGKNVRQQNA